MVKALKSGLKAGFTLIEILVTIIIIAVLAAVVIPAVTNQIGAADPTRVAEDMANIRTGVETFALNVRPRFPGDLDDLANPIEVVNDRDIKNVAYSASSVNAWNGPYISATVPTAGVAPIADIASNTGFKANILSDLATCSSAAGAECDAVTAPQFVAVQIAGLDATQFVAIDEVLDGNVGVASSTGKFRYNASGTAFFLATPYK